MMGKKNNKSRLSCTSARFVVSALIILVSFCFSGCIMMPYKFTPRQQYSGLLVDSDSGLPVANATVTLSRKYDDSVSVLSDTDGRFLAPSWRSWGLLILPADYFPRPWMLTITASGYQTYTEELRSYDMLSNRPVELYDISLRTVADRNGQIRGEETPVVIFLYYQGMQRVPVRAVVWFEGESMQAAPRHDQWYEIWKDTFDSAPKFPVSQDGMRDILAALSNNGCKTRTQLTGVTRILYIAKYVYKSGRSEFRYLDRDSFKGLRMMLEETSVGGVEILANWPTK